MKLSASAAFAIYGALSLQRKTPLGLLSVASKLGGDTANSMLAVRDTYRHLEISGKRETAEAVLAVYGGVSGPPFRSSEITRRIRYFAAEHFMDDRTVYRRLNEARQIYDRILLQYENLSLKK